MLFRVADAGAAVLLHSRRLLQIHHRGHRHHQHTKRFQQTGRDLLSHVGEHTHCSPPPPLTPLALSVSFPVSIQMKSNNKRCLSSRAGGAREMGRRVRRPSAISSWELGRDSRKCSCVPVCLPACLRCVATVSALDPDAAHGNVFSSCGRDDCFLGNTLSARPGLTQPSGAFVEPGECCCC